MSTFKQMLAELNKAELSALTASTAAALGLISHQIFKRNEPTVQQFLLVVFVVNTALTILLLRLDSTLSARLIIASTTNLATYLTTLATSIAIYRLFFHPLRSYPGPILCKLTRFVASKHAMDWDTHLWLTDLHNKYGDVVRVSPNELSFKSVASVDMIHGVKAANIPKGPFYKGDPNRSANSLHSTQDLFEHKWRRKTWERGFGSLQLREYEPRVLHHLDVLVKQLEARIGTPVNMTAWNEYFAYDVMSDLGFSEDFGMLVAGKPHRYIPALHGSTRLITIAAQTPWVRPLMHWFPVDEQTKTDGKDFVQISMATYNRHRERKNKKPDMFSYISAKLEDGPRPMTDKELAADAALIIGAGSVTTALCIAFVIGQLCCNRAHYEQLQKELDACWDGVSPLEVKQLGPQHAPFLEGMINESLRLYPPVPAGVQRQTPPAGITIDGKYVPGNTQLSTHPHAIQRDVRNFSKPDQWIPERWIEARRPADFNHRAKAFIPFTTGQYVCLGKNLAYQEVRLFLAKLMRNFDFAFAEGFDPKGFYDNIKFKGTFLIGPMMLEFTKRGAKPGGAES